MTEDVRLAKLAIQARETLARGEDELIPVELHDRLAAGENPIKVWREHRGMTAAMLSRAAGVAQAELARLESGLAEPSFTATTKIACALRLQREDLLPPRPEPM